MKTAHAATAPRLPLPALLRAAPATAVAVLLLLAAVAPTHAALFLETEPNDTKAAANPVTNFASGDQITGATTGFSSTEPGLASADNFRLSFAPATPGIYRQQINLTAGFNGAINGLTQTNRVIDPGSDISVQITNGGLNQLYTFGSPTSVLYRITGNTTTLGPYLATLTTTPVAPTVAPTSFQAGQLTISALGQTDVDTDLWIYDANFNAIPGFGNDDATPGFITPSAFTGSFAPGVYYVAISDFNLANDQASPASENFTNGRVLESPGAVLNSSVNGGGLDLDFTITDASGVPVAVSVTKLAGFDVNFVQFTVVPEPSTWALAALGGVGLLLGVGQRLRREHACRAS